MASTTNLEFYDILVIGAGLYGIAGARTYLEVHPDCRLLWLDRDVSIGGSWNARRNYETFWSQTGLRMTEYSDKGMILPAGEDTYHDTFRAKHVTQYLEEYLDEHVYAGSSLRDRLRFNFTVDRIEKSGTQEYWTVRGTDRLTETQSTFQASKLMIASGITSEPNMPDLPGRETFKGDITHSEGFGSSSILSSPDKRQVVVIGGGKSSADMVYALAKADKEVSWIIRKSGTGPAAFIDIKGHGRYKNAAEIGNTRLMTSFGPSAFVDSKWKDSWVHRSRMGRAVFEKVWFNADRDIRAEANYHRREGARDGYKNLETETEAFWCNGAVGLLQHPDFWDTIASKVDVYRSDISHLNAHSITTKDDNVISCDAILCGTGWKQSYSFFNDRQVCELGLPHPLNCHCLEDATEWMMLHNAADEEVLAQYPKLAHPPENLLRKPMTKTPYRLYKCIAPLDDVDDRSIVFLGQVKIANNLRVAECQALWATAYLDGRPTPSPENDNNDDEDDDNSAQKIPISPPPSFSSTNTPSSNSTITPNTTGVLTLPPYTELQIEIAYVNAWCTRRYPAQGGSGNYMHYDVIAYTDALLAEIGIKSHRQRGGLLGGGSPVKDFLEPCWASDLKGIVGEYLDLKKMKQEKLRMGEGIAGRGEIKGKGTGRGKERKS